ncbi:MAG: 3-phosphoshikimate 1-carboxyvinyltransferase [Terriglobales bacterium]
MTSASSQRISPAKNVLGSVRLPGDKSISHRYAMLAAVAAGVTRLENFSTGADCANTLSCLKQLGCEVVREGTTVTITPPPRLLPTSTPLDCGNSGSTMRMLAGLLAGKDIACELVGDESLSRRPMARIVDPLRQMGAHIVAENDAHPPLRISPADAPLRGIAYSTPVPSAQVKTALLFAGLSAQGTTEITESIRTRDHGELALRAFGAEVHRSRTTVSIVGGQSLQAITAFVPSDISSAAFFLCAAAIFPGSNLVIESLGLNPTRAALLDVLTALGARLSVINLEEHHGELVGTVKVEHGAVPGSKELKISGATSAQLIDELPVLAAIAPYTANGVEIRDAKELRVKESDRIAAVAANLRKMGAKVEEFDDGLRIPGRQSLHGAELDSAGDHRIAMAFAIAALRAEGDTLIHNADVVSVSFPEFWNMLDSVCER